MYSIFICIAPASEGKNRTAENPCTISLRLTLDIIYVKTNANKHDNSYLLV